MFVLCVALRGALVPRRRGQTVLCIGDDHVALNLRCSLLKERGWTVVSSGGGHEGVRLFQKEKADAVVVDLNDDGAESALITSSIKRIRSDVPVVILVTDANKLAPGATRQADAVVAKSEESNRLHDALMGLLSR